MKKINIRCAGKYFKIEIEKAAYTNNNALALQAYDDEGPFCMFSVNLPQSEGLPKNQCYFKTWSENAGFLEQLVNKGLIKILGPTIRTGCVEAPLVEVLF
jgi:hypothetical protein